MTDYRPNRYDPEDLKTHLDAHDELTGEERSLRAKFAADMGVISRKKKQNIADAGENGIPKSLFKKQIKKRDLRAKMAEIDESVEEEDAELYEDIGNDIESFDTTPLGASAEPDEDDDSPDPTASELAEGAEVLGLKH